jgi:hypothetical protein
VRAYQAKLLEMAQASMTFAFEFSQAAAFIAGSAGEQYCSLLAPRPPAQRGTKLLASTLAIARFG